MAGSWTVAWPWPRVLFTGHYLLGFALDGATKVLPKYKKTILKLSNGVCWGFIISDRQKGIKFELRF